MIDYNKPFKCNDGLKARLAATNGTGTYRVAVWVINPNTNKELLERYDMEGNHISGLPGMKLVNIPENILISLGNEVMAEITAKSAIIKGPNITPVLLSRHQVSMLLFEMNKI